VDERLKVLFISWAPYCSRSDSIAKHFGGRSYMVYHGFFGSRASTIVFKYLSQMMHTLLILLRDRPDVVFVMSPPVFAVAPAWLYAKIFGAGYIVDAHSSALMDRRWQSTMFLARFFSRRAITTIVTNHHLGGEVKAWGARYTLVTDVPVEFPAATGHLAQNGFTVTLVNSFGRDEPLALFLRAAKELPEVKFFVTGRLKDARSAVVEEAPANVRFTDFLSDSDYVGLLQSSHAVMALTTRDHTMQRGAYEAVYLGKPVVTSDFPLLREVFHKGAVHVDNTLAGLVDGIAEIRRNLDAYQSDVTSLRREMLHTWENRMTKLHDYMRQYLGYSGTQDRVSTEDVQGV
jgi:glycosyltransferase involved in cell wall biosynthesis